MKFDNIYSDYGAFSMKLFPNPNTSPQSPAVTPLSNLHGGRVSASKATSSTRVLESILTYPGPGSTKPTPLSRIFNFASEYELFQPLKKHSPSQASALLFFSQLDVMKVSFLQLYFFNSLNTEFLLYQLHKTVLIKVTDDTRIIQ